MRQDCKKNEERKMNDQTQNQAPSYYGFSDSMFEGTKIDFHSFKNGEHRFRILPPYAPDKLFHKLGIHWGYKDQSGGAKALVCSLEEHGTCPICDLVNQQREIQKQLKAKQEELNAMLATASPEQQANIQANLGQIKQKMEDVTAYISEHKRKPTYLWNIMNEEGAQKVLKLSYNGHEPLFNKIKFYWKERRINVTDPNKNLLMWVSRTGQKAQTRYTYEVLEGSEKVLQFNELTDLSKIYRSQSPQDLQQVVEQGYVATTGKTPDPTEQNYSAQPPASNQTPQQQAGANAYTTPYTGAMPAAGQGHSQAVDSQNPTYTQSQPTPQGSPQPSGHPQTQPQPQAQPQAQPQPQTQPQPQQQSPANPQNQESQPKSENIVTTPAQDQNIADMMAALQGNNQQ